MTFCVQQTQFALIFLWTCQKCRKMSKRKFMTSRSKNHCICFQEDSEIIQLSSEINKFRQLGSLCDGVIHCADDKSVKIHRVIVSSVSPYFKNVFGTNQQVTEEKKETTVGISSKYLNLLLDFAYTGSCDINNDNVEELLISADRYEILGVTKLCCQFLINNLNPKNCLKKLNFAKEYFCPGLKEGAKIYLKNNFMKIVKNLDEFLTLNAQEIKDILCDEELNVNCETYVLKAIKLWVEYDKASRGDKAWNLILECICFYQNNVHSLWKKLRKWNVLDENQKYHLQTILIRSARTYETGCPRVPHEIIFAIGGWETGSPTYLIETYDIRADKWFVMKQHDRTPRFYHGVCCLNQLIYLIGGFDGNDHYSSVRCFDPVTQEWREKACMNQARCYVSVTVLDNTIYALGGYNGFSRLNTAERYCPLKNQWYMIASMNKHRSDASAASLEGKVYIVGGIDGRDVLSSGEVYNPLTDQWTYIKPMHIPRSGVCLVVHQNDLFAIGGYDGNRRLLSCEKLTPSDDTDWIFISSLYTGRSNFAAVVMEDVIFVIGGFNGYGTIRSVECYNVNKGFWYHAKSMNYNRSALSACVVSGLPNARVYSYAHKLSQALSQNSSFESE